MSRFKHLIFAALAFLMSTSALAEWPEKPIRLVHGFAPGTTPDAVARLLAERMGAELKQPVIVDGRPGANSNLAAETVSRAAPDGYTLFLATNSLFSVNPLLYKLRFDPFTAFEPISQVVVAQNMLVVRPSLPVGSVAELVAYAKANPGKLSYGSGGAGSLQHLSGELFQRATGTRMVHVAYKGGAPARLDLLSGNIDLMFGDLGAISLVKEGKLRALAVTGRAREQAMPDVPTMQEAGIKEYDLEGFYLLTAPRGTPQDIVARLSQLMASVLQQPEVRQRIVDMGNLPATNTTPSHLSTSLQADSAKLGALVKAARITLE